jgi:1-carboxybiuret hydrolase
MSLNYATASAADIATAVSTGRESAHGIVKAALERIERLDPKITAFTDITGQRALARGIDIDKRIARGEKIGPLTGVPFAVKNLVDIAGLPTRAGSKINRDRKAATRDGAVVRQLEAAGAVLVGALNMGEYAYDFTGENAHDGSSKNPHDLTRMAGGSSGGSGAAVAAGLVPIAIGSSANGSIRVPSSFCGLFGLKPTYGRVSRAGAFPFCGSLDILGPFARSVRDLTLCYDTMQGADPDDPVMSERPPDYVLDKIDAGIDRLRIAIAGGYFARNGDPETFRVVEIVAKAVGAERRVELPEVERARAAAYIMTASEAATLHLDRVRERAKDFDPAVRDRLIAAAMIPVPWLLRAQRFRRWYRSQVLSLFQEFDVILAPATPSRAPRLGQKTFVLGGEEMLVRPNIGIYTQPISFIGLPVVAAPIWFDAGLPLAVQIIAAPWREEVAMRVARHLEQTGVAKAPVASAFLAE